MIFTDYYIGEKITDSEFRYDITKSTESYELFENLLINKRKFNVGGLSFNYVQRPSNFGGTTERVGEKAITKGNSNISTVYCPSLPNHEYGYGDINGTQDALILIFKGKYHSIEIFVARGYKNDVQNLFSECIAGSFDKELNKLRNQSKNVLKV